MGVSGTGKSTIGRALADRMDYYTFVEGDSYHPAANVQKMSAGTPLTDEDRKPWLEALADEIRRLDAAGQRSVTACSALRHVYRDWLRTGYDGLFFVHLQSDFDTLRERMERRQHFMPPSLLQSQFDTLEDLGPDELGAGVEDVPGVDIVLRSALKAIGATD